MEGESRVRVVQITSRVFIHLLCTGLDTAHGQGGQHHQERHSGVVHHFSPPGHPAYNARGVPEANRGIAPGEEAPGAFLPWALESHVSAGSLTRAHAHLWSPIGGSLLGNREEAPRA